MKIIPVALLAGAVPALLAGQTVTIDCPRCQVAPYFAGNGGFVGESADRGGVTEVEFFLVCGQTTISSRIQPDSDGIVRQVLSSASGFSCADGAAGMLEVDNLKPGAWYWINDDQNSAVAPFIPKEAIDAEQIDVTDPGGLEIDTPAGGIGTYVKHAATGRVGIIPRIVPAKPIPGCSGMVGDESASDCHLGSSDGWRLTLSASEVIRPTGTDPEREVVITLHGEDFITTQRLSVRGEVDPGHASVMAIRFGNDGGAPTDEREEGVVKWSVFVGADDTRCLAANNDPDRLNAQTITFLVAAMAGAIPGLGDDGLETSFEVNCPADAAASAGAELVPENPFPVD